MDTKTDEILEWMRALMRFRNDLIKVLACSLTIHASSAGIQLALAIQTFAGPKKHPVPLAHMSATLDITIGLNKFRATSCNLFFVAKNFIDLKIRCFEPLIDSLRRNKWH